MAIKEERKGNLSRGLVFGIFALLWEMQTVWINVWGNTVLCPKSAIPHLGWKLNGNSKCWSCKSCEPCFLLRSLVLFGAAMEELAGSLLPFLLLSFHSHPPSPLPICHGFSWCWSWRGQYLFSLPGLGRMPTKNKSKFNLCSAGLCSYVTQRLKLEIWMQTWIQVFLWLWSLCLPPLSNTQS